MSQDNGRIHLSDGSKIDFKEKGEALKSIALNAEAENRRYKFDLVEPTEDMVDIRDIAFHLELFLLNSD